jgi:hypothetical protein
MPDAVSSSSSSPGSGKNADLMDLATPTPPEAIVEREDLVDNADDVSTNGDVGAAASKVHPVLSPILDLVSWPPRHVAVMLRCDHNLFVTCYDPR